MTQTIPPGESRSRRSAVFGKNNMSLDEIFCRRMEFIFSKWCRACYCEYCVTEEQRILDLFKLNFARAFVKFEFVRLCWTKYFVIRPFGHHVIGLHSSSSSVLHPALCYPVGLAVYDPVYNCCYCLWKSSLWFWFLNDYSLFMALQSIQPNSGSI